jgi:hypothetical protein
LAKKRKIKSKARKTPEWYHARAKEKDGENWESLWCPFCRRVAWRYRDLAEDKVVEMKASPTVRKPYMLDTYECPRKLGFHVGHNYILGRPTLCVGEHK